MLKNKVELKHVVENKSFRFICDNDAPLNFIKESLFQFLKYIGQIEDSALAQRKAEEEAQKVGEPVIDNKIETI